MAMFLTQVPGMFPISDCGLLPGSSWMLSRGLVRNPELLSCESSASNTHLSAHWFEMNETRSSVYAPLATRICVKY